MSLANELRSIRKSIKDDLAQFKELQELNRDQTEIETDLTDIKTRLSSLETFNNIQFNELLDIEVDKAIHARVRQQVFDEVVETIRQQIENGDSELFRQIANASLEINELNGRIENMKAYLDILNETYTILDNSGNQVMLTF